MYKVVICLMVNSQSPRTAPGSPVLAPMQRQMELRLALKGSAGEETHGDRYKVGEDYSKHDLTHSMVFQMWHKAKLPSCIAVCTKLEVSCGFNALLAHQGTEGHILGGWVLLVVHRCLWGLHAGKKLRTPVCNAYLRPRKLFVHTFSGLDGKQPSLGFLE